MKVCRYVYSLKDIYRASESRRYLCLTISRRPLAGGTRLRGICPPRWFHAFSFFFCCIAHASIPATYLPGTLQANGFIRRDDRPVVKPPKRAFKTVLSIDAGGLRNIVSTVVLVEVEQSIKRYLLAHPDLLPEDAEINSVEDFDVELADYFDVMTGVSAGGWMALYLASRGGQGFARRVLDDPVIVEKYGFIPTGSAEGLRVFFNEYGDVLYPPDAVNVSAGEPFDLTNPFSTGVSKPFYSTNGVLEVMEAFVGNMTMADLDTTVIVPAFDIIAGVPVLFVTNAFDGVPVSSSAKMLSRYEPRPAEQAPFTADLQFDEGANYYLKDVAAATGSLPIFYPAMPVARVGNDMVEFLCFDGVYPVDSSATIAGFFTASENGFAGFEEIAMMSLGAGQALRDWTPLANAGLVGWLEGFSLTQLLIESGRTTGDSQLDYFYYSNPNTRPYQYLRIEEATPITTEGGMALAQFNSITLTDFVESIGFKVAREYRQSIDIFVRDFIFN